MRMSDSLRGTVCAPEVRMLVPTAVASVVGKKAFSESSSAKAAFGTSAESGRRSWWVTIHS